MSLYKYLNPDRKDVLESGFIRFTQPSALNDLLEMRPRFNRLAEHGYSEKEFEKSRPALVENALSEDVLRQFYEQSTRELRRQFTYAQFKNIVEKNRTQLDQSLESLIAQIPVLEEEYVSFIKPTIYQLIDENIGALCLTRKPDNQAMWSHYAAENKGFLLEFDEQHTFFHPLDCAPDLGHLHDVMYVDQTFECPPVQHMRATDLFFIKDKEWAYEEECRVLRPLQEANKVLANLSPPAYLFAIPPECISGVVFGCQMIEQSKREIAALLRIDSRYQHVEKREAVLNKEKPGIDIVVSEI